MKNSWEREYELSDDEFEVPSEPYEELTDDEEYRLYWAEVFAEDEFASEDLSEVNKSYDKWARRYDIDEDDHYN